jgi:crotonobetainyl-CoA:carnitine CoA-transferase CaiB-like acyl-CoA transferase
MTDKQSLPLAGVRVIEFTHMVMGPAAGLMLADMGADVIKIEPVGGDATRHLLGSGAGYFPMYNRNKKSFCVNLKSEEGKAAVLKLIEGADVLIENFRPGTMDRLGFGYDDLSKLNPGLIYCSEKGFLPGPYEHRTALDEVAQMMGGLAYMTGPPGQPLRAGASVVDVTGGMFGAIAILGALHQRNATGKGQKVIASLFESTVFLVGQHMAQKAVTGKAAAPMPARVSAWAIYQVFQTKDEPVFVGVVSDKQWGLLCAAFGLDDLADDETLKTNNDRVRAKERLVPIIQDVFMDYTKAELMDKLEKTGLPFAPIAKPEDLFDDEHLNAGGGLVPFTVTDGEFKGEQVELPALPIEMDGQRFGLHQPVPHAGEHTQEVLAAVGYSAGQIHAMLDAGDISVMAD